MKLKSMLNTAIAVAATCAFAPYHADATVKPAAIFSDNMVLQQNATVTMKGTAQPGATVTVATTWSKKKFTFIAGSDGIWHTDITTPAAGGPYEITISDSDSKVTLTGVLTGDVWICAGQSNMEMPVKGYKGQMAYGSSTLLARARADRSLRLFRQQVACSTTPLDTISGGNWSPATPGAVADFSMVGYVFGNFLHENIDIPVGLIHCNWETTNVQAWMSRDNLSKNFPEVKLPDIGQTEFELANIVPTLCYNAMVNAWDGFPVKGAIWYQGESNTDNPALYKRMFPAMVAEWQQIFRNDSMPFYYVQLAPFKAEGCHGTSMAAVRQVQSELLSEMPNVGMATTGDCGDSIFIHPPKKMPVGERLAALALEKTYGRDGIHSEAPVARRAYTDPDDSRYILVEWDHSEIGLAPIYTNLKGFEVVDTAGNIYPAEAVVYKFYVYDKVRVKSPVPDPVEVRYGYHNYYESSLFSNIGLPASPFRLKIK